MSRSKLILVTGSSMVPDSVLAMMRGHGFEVRHDPRDRFSDAELIGSLEQAQGYLIGGEESPTAEVFDAASTLECVAFTGTDYQGMVAGWRRAIDLGIALANTPGANARAVAEFAVLLMLTLARPFTQRISAPGSAGAELGPPGHELQHQSLGIIGLGRIGAAVAEIATGLRMRVRYSMPRRNAVLEQALPIDYYSLDELLADCDIVTLHRPGRLGPDEKPFGDAEFALMKPGSVLINAGHPRLVDPKALLRAAQEKGIRAGFDGHDQGPDWDQLMALGPTQMLFIPSMGFHTAEANLLASSTAATALCHVLNGGTSPNVVNPDFLSVRQVSSRPAEVDLRKT